jgi:large subunit ribosomal protein L4
MTTVSLYNQKAEKLGEHELDDAIFANPKYDHLLHEVVRYQLAKRRQGTHDVKSRAEVSGGGKKPYRQKGTGRARQGTTRAPHYRGGGRAFGPTPRSYAFKLSKRVRAQALRSALSRRVASGDLVVLDELSFTEIRTKDFLAFLDAFETKSALVLLDDIDRNTDLSARNVVGTKVLAAAGLNVYDILKYPKTFVTKAGLEQIVSRFQA